MSTSNGSLPNRVGERSTRRHGALITWAYIPTPKSWDRWIFEVRGR